jgi:hypothetical protein
MEELGILFSKRGMFPGAVFIESNSLRNFDLWHCLQNNGKVVLGPIVVFPFILWFQAAGSFQEISEWFETSFGRFLRIVVGRGKGQIL